jgi:uncharacterized protein YbcV (DUF1398 family)
MLLKGHFNKHLIIMKVIVTLTFLATDRTTTFLFEKGTINTSNLLSLVEVKQKPNQVQ